MTEDHPEQPTSISAVVIGRNEGARLLACLASLQPQVRRLIYVDSGSTDGSVAAARSLGVEVVTLDMTRPFTAARARNAGLAELNAQEGFVQLVDGDCEVDAAWIPQAAEFLRQNPRVAVVCGRRRERFPEVSIYNQICDAEWDTPIGEALACGGDALMRLSALRVVSGYREDLIAGEEPELCLRLRREGWKIWRLEAEMTLHDAQMTRFRQWWMRSRRAGYAFAAGAALHGNAQERHWVKETRRAVFWGIVLPVSPVLLAALISPWALLLWLLYPLQLLRLSPRMGLRPALFSILGKFAESTGIAERFWHRLRGTHRKIIEYK
ncbi:glycosyltransferase family 2 protein [Pseudophaeobacter flagellatus]|uniref:glycosyltransferase family 2 protein n=1 Tax=Pseudophaeobacter flagellatus TaxID=2899119 RepID=UPI001E5FD652|nr:glycosyltransferase [Pseudophaeobacter flagellatus]MCD9148354.1 glycosyltransferase [Pseudophaeobacter flagellatus]